jgi:hypothetical protein
MRVETGWFLKMTHGGALPLTDDLVSYHPQPLSPPPLFRQAKSKKLYQNSSTSLTQNLTNLTEMRKIIHLMSHK